MERKVIAVRNGSAMIMNFVFAGFGVAALGVLVWLTATSDDASYISVGSLACAVALGMALWYGIPAVLMLGAPVELIVKNGENFIINGKTVPLTQIAEGQLKEHRKNGGEYSYGDIFVYLKNGGKLVCRGVGNAKESYAAFCAEVTGGYEKRERKKGQKQ